MTAAAAEGDSLRLFFALWPGESQRSAAAAAAAVLPLAAPTRAVPRAKYHLTVAFIGGVPGGSLERVRGIGREVRSAAFSINFDAYEYWPKPQVIVAAARLIPPALQTLWSDLHGALARARFELRVKKLRPHITLAHRVEAEPRLPPLAGFTWRASELCLVRSDAGAAQQVYTVVDTWPLLDKPERG